MNIFLRLSFLFFVGCLGGWVLELFYRRIVGKKWVNPGLLKGPYLPIYGFGLTLMYLICLVDFSFISLVWLQHVVRILFMGVVMTLIEYIGGIIFIRGMNIMLWDYSKNWGNIQGVICPLFSAIWTAIGAAYYYLLNPYIGVVMAWFENNLEFSFFVGLFFGIFLIDFVTTMQLAAKIRKFAKESKFVVRFEKLKADIKDFKKEAKEKLHFGDFFNSFRGDLKEYIKKHKEKLNKKEREKGESNE